MKSKTLSNGCKVSSRRNRSKGEYASTVVILHGPTSACGDGKIGASVPIETGQVVAEM